MMEFTLTRVSVCLCGAVLIGVLFNPFMSVCDDRAENMCQDNCNSIGDMFDSFMSSEADECTISLNLILPDSESSLSFNDRLMTLSNERGSWQYSLRHAVEADSDQYSANDFIQITKDGGDMHIITL